MGRAGSISRVASSPLSVPSLREASSGANATPLISKSQTYINLKICEIGGICGSNFRIWVKLALMLRSASTGFTPHRSQVWVNVSLAKLAA